MKNERKRMPGFITLKTENEILEYMKKLEWKIDELQSINMNSQVQ